MRNYLIAMGLRVVCFFVLILVPITWVRITAVIGAAVLPYFAVMMANFVDRRRQATAPIEPGYPESRPALSAHLTVEGSSEDQQSEPEQGRSSN